MAADRTALTALEEAAGGDAAVLAALQSTYRKARMERQRSAHPSDGQRRGQGSGRQRNQRLHQKPTNIVCFACGQHGHIRAQCRQHVSVLTADAAPDPDPADGGIHPEVMEDRANACILWSVNKITKACRRVDSCLSELPVLVSHSESSVYRLLAVADTGAECCVAGLDQMRALQLTEGNIDPSDANLRHAGGGALKVLGSKTCHLRVGDRVTTEMVFFVRGV